MNNHLKHQIGQMPDAYLKRYLGLRTDAGVVRFRSTFNQWLDGYASFATLRQALAAFHSDIRAARKAA